MFDSLIGLLPTVYITDPTTGAPYTAGQSVMDPASVCCSLVYAAYTANPGLAPTVTSNPFHNLHRAESLRVATVLPSSVLAGDALPDIEVQVMTTTEQYRDASGTPLAIPLLHGYDTGLDIQATVVWDQKVFAFSPPFNFSTVGMDLSPLMSSNVLMTGVNATKTYIDDIAIRSPAALLPSGYYGAVFKQIKLLNTSTPAGVKLNFTLSYPGGQQYDTDLALKMMTPPIPYTRAGLGFPEYTPVWTGKQSTFWPNVLQPATNIVLGTNITSQLYVGLAPSVIWARSQNASAPTSMCAPVKDPQRKQWCIQSGHTYSTSTPDGPCTALTSPIIVMGMFRSMHALLSADNMIQLETRRSWSSRGTAIQPLTKWPTTRFGTLSL